jgi:hypothetical protein
LIWHTAQSDSFGPMASQMLGKERAVPKNPQIRENGMRIWSNWKFFGLSSFQFLSFG